MSSFEKYFEKATSPGPDRILPGAVVLVANKDGVIYEKSGGTQSLDPSSPLANKPLDADTTMWIASCTKLMTAISVMQCVERGQLNLDADIVEVLPELKDVQIIKSFDAEKGPVYEEKKGKITLRHLLSHSSGLSYKFMSLDLILPLTQWREEHDEGFKKMNDFVKEHHHPLLFEPGTAWSYSVGNDWAGEMVARVNKQSLGEYFQEHIWGPLGMTSTTFNIAARKDMLERRPDMSMRKADGKLILSQTRYVPDSRTYDSGGGGLFSCPNDYIKVLIALLKNDGTLLKPASLDQLFVGQLQDSAAASYQNVLYGRYPGNENLETSNALAGVPESSKPTYGLAGMVVQEDVVGTLRSGGKEKRRKKGSISWGGLPNLSWLLDRDTGIALLYASQLLPPGDALSVEAWEKFELAVYGGELTKL